MAAQAPGAVDDRPAAAMARSVYGVPLTSEAFLSLGSMEGLFDAVVARPGSPAVPHAAAWPGYLLTAGVAAVAYGLHFLPVAPFTMAGTSGVRHPISAAILAIVIGLLVGNALTLPLAIKPGCKRAVKKLIPIAIVLTGASLNLMHVRGIGAAALTVTLLCIGLAVAAGYSAGRLSGLKSKTAVLLGAGTGICGNSAIVAVAPLIDAEDQDVAVSVGTVNLLGLAAMLAWPAIGVWLHVSAETFGVWAGSSIHAVPQVVAAGFAFSTDAGTLATLVKLVRVACLAPLIFALAVFHARKYRRQQDGDALTVHYARLVPWFVWGFLTLAALNTLGLIPDLHFSARSVLAGKAQATIVPLSDLLAQGGKIMLTGAMAAIGLELNLRQLAGVGSRALTAGVISTLALGAASLTLTVWLL